MQHPALTVPLVLGPVMLADVPHGEAIVPVAGKPAPSFSVTESRDLPLDVIDLRKYRLRVAR